MILEVDNLIISFAAETGRIRAVDGAGFKLEQGTTLGIVGESGCGKSVAALAIMGLLPKPSGIIESGTIRFKNRDIVPLMGKYKEMQRIRGREISMIFQEPMTALNPVHTIRNQMNEVYKLHFSKMKKHEMDRASIDMLNQVGIANPERVMFQYPHQLSGGMRQRVMIAMALSSKPSVLIADEPTTALDVTVQAQILDMINELKQKSSMSVILITHDLGVVAENCDDAVVMYGGRAAERAKVSDLFKSPLHPYTQGLLKSIPSISKIPKSILPSIRGVVPSLEDMPSGCRFSNRCDYVMDICRTVPPEEIELMKGHFAACYKFYQ